MHYVSYITKRRAEKSLTCCIIYAVKDIISFENRLLEYNISEQFNPNLSCIIPLCWPFIVDRRGTRMSAAKETEEREEGQLFSPSFSPLLSLHPSSMALSLFLDPLLGEKVWSTMCHFKEMILIDWLTVIPDLGIFIDHNFLKATHMTLFTKYRRM